MSSLSLNVYALSSVFLTGLARPAIAIKFLFSSYMPTLEIKVVFAKLAL